MKAVRFHQYGEPSVLQYEEAEQPTPGAGQVLIRVAGTSFNGIDGNIRAGFMQGPIPVTLPHTPGIDVSGTIDALGEGVTGWAKGDNVIGFLPMTENGASAEYVVAPADILATAPNSIPLGDAAALPTVGLTALQSLFEHGQLQAGQRVLINGAGGAVGGYAVQLAKAAGVHVIATASARSAAEVTANGADEVIDHTTSDVLSAVTEPVNVLLNLAPINPEQFARLVSVVADGGLVVSTTVWMPVPTDEARNVRGVNVYVRSDAEQLADLSGRIDKGELTVAIGERVALPDLPALHARAAEGQVSRKVVVLVS